MEPRLWAQEPFHAQGCSDGAQGSLPRLRVRTQTESHIMDVLVGPGLPPLCGAAGLGTKQVAEESLELWVPEGLQAARNLEGDVPKWPF